MSKKKKKDWVKKLRESKDLPRVEKISPRLAKRWGKGTVVIPAPVEVDKVMKRVPKGELITASQIRQILAKKHKATIGCPLTCGIFINIAARAAEQEKEEGKKKITPYWRTLKSRGQLNPKYPGGVKKQKKLLEKEGHQIARKGKNYFVAGYQKKLI
jgi:hypothetical protein